ncbi:MAG TPA: hypothetical protein VMY42_19895 [Thermoguttaceae bacterium]|nr:hypothetical protein [Thermoguttaceae bacterium]
MSAFTGTAVVAEDTKKVAEAERLSELSGGDVVVEFAPDAFFGGDPTSSGHIYTASRVCENDTDFLTLDDRRRDALPVQLVNELRRIAGLYSSLAGEIEAKLAAT